jgi:hypothetical protein
MRVHFRGTDELDLSGAEVKRSLHPGTSQRLRRRPSFIAPAPKQSSGVTLAAIQ